MIAACLLSCSHDIEKQTFTMGKMPFFWNKLLDLLNRGKIHGSDQALVHGPRAQGAFLVGWVGG